MNNPINVLLELDAVRQETLGRLEALTQEQLDARPPHSDGEQAWSAGEIIMHLAIDELYVRELIARPLLEGILPPEDVSFLPPPPPYGTPKDAIRFWLERARSQTRNLLEGWDPGADLSLTHTGGLRAMNALEWFEGYAGHERFHHRQIDALSGDEEYSIKGTQ